MKTLFLLTLTLLAPALAQAESFSLPESNLVDLTEVASPEEIAEELYALDGDFDSTIVPSAAPRLVVKVSKQEQRLWVYEDGNLTGSWLVSTGTEARKCPPNGGCYRATTPVGDFTPQRMYERYTSKKWNARMDYAIFIVGGIALHMTDHVEQLGTRASGGCIRQRVDNAQRLFQLVRKYGMANTLVQVR
jgi:lipoprotein-anchoring transpeptidase ErfK/SrfK